ncbi:MAG: phospholipid carrier-dependent glycosyltransferase [Lysobacterales bacterium]
MVFGITKNSFYAVVAASLILLLWFGMLGHRDLFDPDEGRYAEIPAAMVDSGDWLTPRLNGLKYFEKPVLQYWGTAVIYKLLGKSNATARLFTALMGLTTALFVMWVAFRLYGKRAAAYTFLITISSMMVVTFAHLLTLDMSLTAFIIIGIGSLVIAQTDRDDDKRTRNWMLVAWAALALGTLTKGLIAVVLPAISVLAYSIWQRDTDLWKKLHLFKGVLLYVLIAAPWFVAVSYKNPEFAKFFFIHEHFDRYTSQVHGREGPVYYFIPFLILGVCPWLITSIKSIIRPGFSWAPCNPGAFNPERFLWVFVIVTFIFYSLGQSKLPAYILPIFPVIAVISGGQISRTGSADGDRWILFGLGLALVLLALNLESVATRLYPLSGWLAYQPWLLASGLLFWLAAATLFVFKKTPLNAFAIAAVLSLASMQLVNLGLNSLSESRSSRKLADAITSSVPDGTPVFSYRTFSKSAAFYLGKPIKMVDYSGELKLGIDSEPDNYIGSFDEFEKTWRALGAAALIANIDAIDNEHLKKLHGSVVYEGPGRMVIIKHPIADPSRRLTIAGAP